ncbi:hypothetical protein EW145_g1624 [Phellinidium pouzarii]|uniref:Phytocyanin domain-containing protein n=1 Tax=Phellinidium pouzarii TaxID=167371 RepID=A0A4S4LEB2_9AGAM|nr:hypothetical protein EW145_g1624 [Phellinidium pouzarii]
MLFAASTAFAVLSLAAIPARAAVFNVTVGGPGILRYNPEFVNAEPGDEILFTFMQKNHTVTQSTFAEPCSFAPGGFDTGFQPVADNVTEGFPTQTLTISDTSPIWVYCRQTGHCQQGMVFAVNPGSNFAAFQAAANASGTSTTSAAGSATSTVSDIASISVVTVTATVTASGGDVVTTTYGSYPGSAEPTNAGPTDHKIEVGGTNLLTYNPSNITAQPGDTVTFTFNVKNHTATQSNFAEPCRPFADTAATPGQVGFDSGFMAVSANATTFPTFTVTVNDTKPIWVYCRQTGHCGQGMVFSVNAIESGPNNFAAFQALAMQQNGTSASASSTASGSTSSSASGAMSFAHVDASILLGVVGTFFGLLL